MVLIRKAAARKLQDVNQLNHVIFEQHFGPKLGCQFEPFDVLRHACYHRVMIKGYRDKNTEALAANRYVKAFDSIQIVARKKLDILKSAKGLTDLAAVPGNRLEALHGDREGQWSIRINDQFRICFVPDGEDFNDVEITDYH